MSYGLLDVARDLVKGNVDYVKPAIREQRVQVCLACDNLRSIPIAKVGQCKLCGCLMDGKTMLSRAECPAGKWIK